MCSCCLFCVVLPYVLQNVISPTARPIKYQPSFLCHSLILTQSLECNNNCTILFIFYVQTVSTPSFLVEVHIIFFLSCYQETAREPECRPRAEYMHSFDVGREAFPAQSTQESHQRKHGMERPHTCDMCNKSFSKRSVFEDTSINTQWGASFLLRHVE